MSDDAKQLAELRARYVRPYDGEGEGAISMALDAIEDAAASGRAVPKSWEAFAHELCDRLR